MPSNYNVSGLASGGSSWDEYLKNLLPGLKQSYELDPAQTYQTFLSTVFGDGNTNKRSFWSKQYGKVWSDASKRMDTDFNWFTDYLSDLQNSGRLDQEYSFTDPFNRSGGLERPGNYAPTMRMVR